MSNPDERAEVQGLKVYAYVSRLAEHGATPVEIRQQLIEKGVDPQEATRLTDRLAATQAKRAIRVRATGLLIRGVAPDQVQSGLVQEGFDPALVAEEVSALLAERAREDKEWREDPPRLWRLFGAALVVVGVGVYIGNTTGAFPTLPYPGGVLMGIGGLVSALGWLRGVP
jgi:hypothetical protein